METTSTNVMVDGKAIDLMLVDTRGEDYDKLLSYSNTNVFLIVFSVYSRSSFWNTELVWLKEIRRINPNAPFILCGTKIDLRDDNPNKIDCVSFKEGCMMAFKIGAHSYVENSCLTQKGIMGTFEEGIF